MMEAVQPLSTSAVTMVVQSEAGFRKFTLISKDEVLGLPCIMTILRSSFGWGTKSEILFAGEGGTLDLGGEATSFTPRLRENPPLQLSASLTLSLSSHRIPELCHQGLKLIDGHRGDVIGADIGLWDSGLDSGPGAVLRNVARLLTIVAIATSGDAVDLHGIWVMCGGGIWMWGQTVFRRLRSRVDGAGQAY